MSKSPQVPCESAFATADINRPSLRGGHNAKELITVVTPETIVPGSSRPLNPLIGPCFPTVPEVHCRSPISMNVDVYFRRASLFHTFFVERSDRCHFAFWQTAPRKQGRGPLLGESGSDPLVSAGGVVRQPMTRLDFRIP